MRTIDLREHVDIEALLVWTYRHQRADRVLGGGMGLFAQEASLAGCRRSAASADGVAAMQRIGALGTRVDSGRTSASHLHIDAEVVHDAVSALPRDVATMVIEHARAATRPDDTAIPPVRIVPVPNRLGRPTVRYDAWDKHGNYGWCEVAYTSPPVTAEMIRVEYATWHGALVGLAATLANSTRLTRHLPYRPRAPAQPSHQAAQTGCLPRRHGFGTPTAKP